MSSDVGSVSVEPVTVNRVKDGINDAVRLIALYLPQFHPIPENDAWWGMGFTEWANVARARPLFHGHYQPHLPADLGFYDLRLPETRFAQAEMASKYGIGGFCYYHYWFHGRRLLERPVNDILQSQEPDFPFCLCWANETWSRRWLGEEKEVLLGQSYSPEDDRNHAHWLLEAFADKRYIRVGNRPMFLIYRPDHLPQPKRTIEIFRETAERAGVPAPWLVAVDSHRPGADYRPQGFDATLGFEPQLGVFAPDCFRDRRSLTKLVRNLRLGIGSSALKVYDDQEARRLMKAIRRPATTIPCCYVSWDNTPRRGRNGIVYVNGSPACFRHHLTNAIEGAQKCLPAESRMVFINAWNEWAEGNHLEPDQKHGHAYLESVSAAIKSTHTVNDAEEV